MPFIPSNIRGFDPNLSTFAAKNFEYTSDEDDLATIKTAGYFSKTVEDTNNITNSLKVDDLIYIHGTDGSEQLKISAIEPQIVTKLASNIITASFLANTVGGSANEIFSSPGSSNGDVVFTQLVAEGVPGLRIVSAVTNISGDIDVLFTADPTAFSVIALMTTKTV